MPFLSVFSGVAQGPHQSTPNRSNSCSVVAPLMNAHSSPMGLCQNDLTLRSVMTGNPSASWNRMVCCMTVSALTPCLVSPSTPAPRMCSRTRRYSVEAGRWSYGRYSIGRQLSGAVVWRRRCLAARPTGWAFGSGEPSAPVSLRVGAAGDRGACAAHRDAPGRREHVGDEAVRRGELGGMGGAVTRLGLGAGEPVDDV